MLSEWLQQALERAEIGQAELARRLTDEFGLSVDRSIVNKLVKGTRKMSADELFAISKITGEPIPETKTNTVRVMGRIGAGAEIEPEFEQLGPDGLFEVEVAIPLPPDMIGFEVVGDSMYPRFYNGDVVICAREGEPQALPDGEEAAVRTSDGRRFLKRVMRDGERFRLESHNAPPIVGVGLEWASPVELTVPHTRWKKLGNGNGKPTPSRKGRKV